jgi:glutamyl-tRNA synthetase
MPEGTDVVMQDLIRGEVVVNTSTLDDKVLFKSVDMLPTYHLANVTDDYLMDISHVIRGEEWLPSLPLHVLLYQALGWTGSMPLFAHLPLLLKPSGNGKLSKRDGDKMGFPVFPLYWKSPEGETSRGYREDGYFPEAFVNLLAFLGWNPGTEQEILSMDELIELFSLERVNKSGARFDPEKAKWFNHQYLIKKSNAELAELFLKHLNEKGITAVPAKVEKIVGLVKERVSFVHEIWDQSYFFFTSPETYDEATVKKAWSAETPELMKKVLDFIPSIEPFNAPDIEHQLKDYINTNNLGMGKVMNALRLSLVGASKGPGVADICEVIGKEETLKRINKAIQSI